MNTPIYRPEQWVLYEDFGETGGFGRIVGASFDGSAWHYSIHGPITDTTYASAKEDEITHVYESGSWIEHHSGVGGGASAYAAPDPELENAEKKAQDEIKNRTVKLVGALPAEEAAKQEEAKREEEAQRAEEQKQLDAVKRLEEVKQQEAAKRHETAAELADAAQKLEEVKHEEVQTIPHDKV